MTDFKKQFINQIIVEERCEILQRCTFEVDRSTLKIFAPKETDQNFLFVASMLPLAFAARDLEINEIRIYSPTNTPLRFTIQTAIRGFRITLEQQYNQR